MAAQERRLTSPRGLAVGVCLALLPLLAGCAAPASAPRHFTFRHVQDATSGGAYRVASTAEGTATGDAYFLSILVVPRSSGAVVIHPTASVRFDTSGVHCFGAGTGPHDAVTLRGTTTVRLQCEEPFPDPAHVRGITVTEGGA